MENKLLSGNFKEVTKMHLSGITSLSPSRSDIVDIDECADDNGGCHHDCINTPGSHICECDPGYELHVDLKMCLRELQMR